MSANFVLLLLVRVVVRMGRQLIQAISQQEGTKC